MPREQHPLNPAELSKPSMPISALCLPARITERAEVLLMFIRQREAERRDYTLTRALGFTEGLEAAEAISRPQRGALQQIYCDADLQAWEGPPNPRHSMLPRVAVEGDSLVIRITTECLLHAVTISDRWPMNYQGEPGATITDPVLFVEEIIAELTREDEQGANALHHLLDEAAENALEAGSQAVEFHEEGGDE